MLPMKSVRLQLGNLLAADTTTLAPVSANKVALIAAAFTPSENLVIGDLTLASFTGSAPIAGAAGAQGVGIDPTTEDQVITNLAPAGGWRYVCTAAPATPQPIYGAALINNAGSTLLAVEAFPVPITITNVGDYVDLGALALNIVQQPIS